MLTDLTLQQAILAHVMSDISEKCYSAGWMMNVEYALWDAVINGERKYGWDMITASNIARLKKLSENCNCWIYFDDRKEETAIELSTWKEKFSNDLLQDPTYLMADHHMPDSSLTHDNDLTILYRPVGPRELALIRQSGWTRFPPRLPEQPIFYPVMNEEYAIQIARDWNVPASGSGYACEHGYTFRLLYLKAD